MSDTIGGVNMDGPHNPALGLLLDQALKRLTERGVTEIRMAPSDYETWVRHAFTAPVQRIVLKFTEGVRSMHVGPKGTAGVNKDELVEAGSVWWLVEGGGSGYEDVL